MTETEKDAILTIEYIEHYRTQARKAARETKTAFDLSMKIKDTYEIYSDRWNPARLAYVRELEKELIKRCMKQYDYIPELYVGL